MNTDVGMNGPQSPNHLNGNTPIALDNRHQHPAYEWGENMSDTSGQPHFYGSHPPDYYDYSVPNAAMGQGRDSGGSCSGEIDDNKIKHEDGDQFIPLSAYTDQPPLNGVPGFHPHSGSSATGGGLRSPIQPTSNMHAVDMDANELLKIERKRARNRAAATKCRLRKLERISVLDKEAAELRAANDALTSDNERLRDQVSRLQQELRWHLNHGCPVSTWTANNIESNSCAENDGDDEALKNLSLGAAQATIKAEAQQEESVVLNTNASPDSTTSHSNANASALTSSNDVPNPYQPQQHVTKLPPFHNRIRHSI